MSIEITLTCDLCGEVEDQPNLRPTTEAPRAALLRMYESEDEYVDWQPEVTLDLCRTCRSVMHLLFYPEYNPYRGPSMTTSLVYGATENVELARLNAVRERLGTITAGMYERLDAAIGEASRTGGFP